MQAFLCLALVVGGLATTCKHLSTGLPDSSCTPGKPFTGTQCGGKACVKSTLCKSGYSRTVRSVPASEKDDVYKSYGAADHAGFCKVKNGEGCEIDHLISLEIGGSNDQSNLWPQPYDTPVGKTTLKWNAHVKDTLENKLKKLFCTDEITLHEAQSCISTDWIACYKKHMGTDEPIENCGGHCDWLDDDDDDAKSKPTSLVI